MHDSPRGAAPGPTDAEALAWVARVARLVESPDGNGLGEALAAVVDGLGLCSAVLRDAVDGEVLAVAGDVVHAVPRSREVPHGPQGVVEVPVPGPDRPLAGLTVVGARPSQLPALRAAAAVLGLGLRRPGPGPLGLALLEAADAHADATADALHDGPVQELVAARYAADAAVRGGDATTVRDAVQGSLVALRRALWLLRPRGAGSEGLAAVLAQLSSRLQEAGRPGLLLDVDATASARLSPRAASVCYRLVQEVAGREGGPATAVRLTGVRELRLEVDGDVSSVVASAPLWSARARALGAELVLPPPTARSLLVLVPASAPDLPAPVTPGTDEPRRSP